MLKELDYLMLAYKGIRDNMTVVNETKVKAENAGDATAYRHYRGVFEGLSIAAETVRYCMEICEDPQSVGPAGRDMLSRTEVALKDFHE